jgi:SAM-dependent methyltransferase
MVGKMILPLLGGTPAVWSTCMVFFQAMLLAGYAYAHASTAWLGVRRQAILHVVMLVLPLAVLPLAVDPARLRGGEANPVLDVLLLLSLSVGLPFLVVSATAPLLQKWFTRTGHPAARDPYFLYAASNLGSMLALLGYPTLIEPRLHLRGSGWLSQTGLWSLAYLVLAGLVGLSALMLWRGVSAQAAPPPDASATMATPAPPLADPTPPEEIPPDAPAWSRRLRWVALAFVPSSLLLGVTTYITTDIAAVPLLWVIPLAIYLLTFILAFGRWPTGLHRAVVMVSLPVVFLVLFLIVSGSSQRIWVTVLWHLLLLLTVALACHGELALTRPSPAYLTGFYLLISVGGVLGGLFNALVAPAVFNSLLEYPLVMVLACMLIGPRVCRPAATDRRRALLLVLGWPLGVGALAFILYSELLTARLDFAFVARLLDLKSEWTTEWLDPIQRLLNRVLVYGPPIIASYFVRRRPLVMGLALAAVLTVTGFVDRWNNEQIHQARSFFGALRITRDRDDKGYTELRHGTTLHGRQSLDPERRGEPLSYYYRQGPIGQVFAELDKRSDARRVAVIGLGTGTLAAYARTGDAMTFYEIDRLVRDIAFDRAYFTYVTDARDRGAALRVELGDARIRLDAVRRERPGERYDLIAVDAFTSDAIPVHLLTREAFRLYFEMLNPGGLLAVHISNRYLDLEPVVANLAADAALGGRLIQQEDAVEVKGAAESTWAVLARTPEALGGLARDERWTREKLALDPRVGTWTDDFHNVLSVFKWR